MACNIVCQGYIAYCRRDNMSPNVRDFERWKIFSVPDKYFYNKLSH